MVGADASAPEVRGSNPRYFFFSQEDLIKYLFACATREQN